MQTLAGKIAVITGSTHGFGYTLAHEMLLAGATVVISGRSPEALAQTVEELRSRGEVSGFDCDVRDEKQVYALAGKTLEKYGRIDIWVNNAGYSAGSGMVLDVPPAMILDMFLANDLGTYYGTQAALHHMLERKTGVLVNLYGAGSNGKAASPTGMYATTKAWITSFTRSLASEIRNSGVQVIGFSPGMMLTGMLTQPVVFGERGKEKMSRFSFVLRFLAKPPEIAAGQLVRVLAKNKREFVEIHVMKPWTPLLGLIRVGWENLTKTGTRPEYFARYVDAYRPDFRQTQENPEEV